MHFARSRTTSPLATTRAFSRPWKGSRSREPPIWLMTRRSTFRPLSAVELALKRGRAGLEIASKPIGSSGRWLAREACSKPSDPAAHWICSHYYPHVQAWRSMGEAHRKPVKISTSNARIPVKRDPCQPASLISSGRLVARPIKRAIIIIGAHAANSRPKGADHGGHCLTV